MSLISDITDSIRAEGHARAQGQAASGQLWGSTLANIGQTFGALPAQQQQRQAQAQQSELRNLDIQEGRAKLADADKARQKQAAIQQVLGQYDNIDDAIPAVMRIDPASGMALQKHVTEAKKEALDFRSKQIKNASDTASFIGSKLGAATDQGTYTKSLHTLKLALPDQDWSAYPDDYEQAKPQIQTAVQGAMSVEKQTEIALKKIDDERLAAAQKSLEAHQRASEKTTAENIEADNKRLDAAAAETVRNHKAMEAAALLRARRPSSGGSQSNTSDVKESVTGMREGTIPPQLPGRASKDYTATMAEAHRQGYDLAGAVMDWTATQKHLSSLNSTQQLRLNQAINQLPELLDSVDALAAKWKGGRFPILNRANLAAAKNGVYGEDVASVARQLSTQIADVNADLGTVYMGGNSPTDHALKLAETALSGDWSEKVLHDMTTLARKNVQTRHNSIIHTGVSGASPANPYDRQPQPQPTGRYDPVTGLVK